MEAQDILLTTDYDLAISDGDFVIGESDNQHIELIIQTATGAWKQFPTLGVGIIRYSGSTGQINTLRREINVNLKADGYINIDTRLLQNTDEEFIYYVDAKRNG
jgi:hypothetical protein